MGVENTYWREQKRVDTVTRTAMKQIFSAEENSGGGIAKGIILDLTNSVLPLEDAVETAEHRIKRQKQGHKVARKICLLVKKGESILTIEA